MTNNQIIISILLMVCITHVVYAIDDDSMSSIQDAIIHNDYADAIARLSALLSTYPTDDEVYLYLGMLYEQIQQYDLAVKIYKRGISLNSTHVLIMLYNLGNTYSYMKQYSEAEQVYSQAIAQEQIYKNNNEYARTSVMLSHVYLNRANARVKMKQYKAAISDYSTFLELFPDNTQEKNIKLMIALLQQDLFFSDDSDELLQNIGQVDSGTLANVGSEEGSASQDGDISAHASQNTDKDVSKNAGVDEYGNTVNSEDTARVGEAGQVDSGTLANVGSGESSASQDGDISAHASQNTDKDVSKNAGVDEYGNTVNSEDTARVGEAGQVDSGTLANVGSGESSASQDGDISAHTSQNTDKDVSKNAGVDEYGNTVNSEDTARVGEAGQVDSGTLANVGSGESSASQDGDISAHASQNTDKDVSKNAGVDEYGNTVNSEDTARVGEAGQVDSGTLANANQQERTDQSQQTDDASAARVANEQKSMEEQYISNQTVEQQNITNQTINNAQNNPAPDMLNEQDTQQLNEWLEYFQDQNILLDDIVRNTASQEEQLQRLNELLQKKQLPVPSSKDKNTIASNSNAKKNTVSPSTELLNSDTELSEAIKNLDRERGNNIQPGSVDKQKKLPLSRVALQQLLEQLQQISPDLIRKQGEVGKIEQRQIQIPQLEE